MQIGNCTRWNPGSGKETSSGPKTQKDQRKVQLAPNCIPVVIFKNRKFFLMFFLCIKFKSHAHFQDIDFGEASQWTLSWGWAYDMVKLIVARSIQHLHRMHKRFLTFVFTLSPAVNFLILLGIKGTTIALMSSSSAFFVEDSGVLWKVLYLSSGNDKYSG